MVGVPHFKTLAKMDGKSTVIPETSDVIFGSVKKED